MSLSSPSRFVSPYLPPPCSHAWLGTVGKLLDTVFGFLSSASEDTRVWIDCIAINQHGDTNGAQNKADVSAFEDVLQLCGGGTIVVVDMGSGTNPASRGWCLYEWDYTLHYHGPDGLHMTVRGGRMPSITAGMMRSRHMTQDMCRGGGGGASLTAPRCCNGGVAEGGKRVGFKTKFTLPMHWNLLTWPSGHEFRRPGRCCGRHQCRQCQVPIPVRCRHDPRQHPVSELTLGHGFVMHCVFSHPSPASSLVVGRS